MAKIIGLTGGIASGKSTVSKYLTDKGLALVDADQLVHDLQFQKKPLYNVLIGHFGEEFSTEEEPKVVNRAKLGQLLFADPEKMAWASKLQDPIIREELAKKRDELAQDNQLVFLDIPLLFEKNYQDWCDDIWLVTADEETQLQRLMARNGLNREEAEQRLASQMPQADKIPAASLILDNTGGLEDLYQQVDKALQNL